MPHVVPLIHLSHDFRRQIFHISVLVVAGQDAAFRDNCTPTTSARTGNRIPGTGASGDDISEKFDAVGEAQLPEAQSSSRIIRWKTAH